MTTNLGLDCDSGQLIADSLYQESNSGCLLYSNALKLPRSLFQLTGGASKEIPQQNAPSEAPKTLQASEGDAVAMLFA